jgi:hypothetical protein
MESRRFNIPDHNVEARLARLAPAQAGALEKALEGLSGTGTASERVGNREGLPLFLLPLAETGLAAHQMIDLAERVPGGYALDHREIYFDFRLGRWMKHIEPPTVDQILDEYIENAESKALGLAYLKEKWREFLRRQGAE